MKIRSITSGDLGYEINIDQKKKTKHGNLVILTVTLVIQKMRMNRTSVETWQSKFGNLGKKAGLPNNETHFGGSETIGVDDCFGKNETYMVESQSDLWAPAIFLISLKSK